METLPGHQLSPMPNLGLLRKFRVANSILSAMNSNTFYVSVTGVFPRAWTHLKRLRTLVWTNTMIFLLDLLLVLWNTLQPLLEGLQQQAEGVVPIILQAKVLILGVVDLGTRILNVPLGMLLIPFHSVESLFSFHASTFRSRDSGINDQRESLSLSCSCNNDTSCGSCSDQSDDHHHQHVHGHVHQHMNRSHPNRQSTTSSQFRRHKSASPSR